MSRITCKLYEMSAILKPLHLCDRDPLIDGQTAPPAGAAGAEERHRTHLRHEDLKEGRHAGEGAGGNIPLSLAVKRY